MLANIVNLKCQAKKVDYGHSLLYNNNIIIKFKKMRKKRKNLAKFGDDCFRRHKCFHCGSVRQEYYMAMLMRDGYDGEKRPVKTRYGHIVWHCKDRCACVEMAKYYNVY